MSGSDAGLAQAFDALPTRFAGTGGAAVVLRDGAVLEERCWGWADAERRIPFTRETLFRICSITKQFVVGAMLDAFPDPAVLDTDIAARLPLLQGPRPGALHLAHNQSGLRDYWATAMLCGAPAEGVFGPEEARALIARSRSLHFAPGTRFSYCNQNFRLIGDVVADRLGRPLGDVLRTRLFDRAGMPRALLAADTQSLPDGTIGYEGAPDEGHRAAVNRIHWTGDAGIAASLEDMIAWERFIDATRDEPGGLYARLAAPVTFADGAPATYGFGLGRGRMLGRDVVSHGGGLRGWRSFRGYLPAERVSVVVLFNHMADPRDAALTLLEGLFGPAPIPPPGPAGAWDGRFLEPETGLATRIATKPDGHIRLHFAGGPDTLDARSPELAESGPIKLRLGAHGIVLQRDGDNLVSLLQPISGPPAQDIEGRYVNDEYDAQLTIHASGTRPGASASGAFYGAFSGWLGQGIMTGLIPVGGDVWLLPCPRALDYSPPGDWTLHFTRTPAGAIDSVTIGCWLARGLVFRRM